MTCSRVIIINKGRIEACDTPENLLGRIRTAGGVTLEAKVGADDAASRAKENHRRPRRERDRKTTAGKFCRCEWNRGRMCVRRFSVLPAIATGRCAN